MGDDFILAFACFSVDYFGELGRLEMSFEPFSKFYVFDLHTGKASHTYYDSFAEAAAVVDSLNESRMKTMIGLGFKSNQLTDRYQVRGMK